MFFVVVKIQRSYGNKFYEISVKWNQRATKLPGYCYAETREKKNDDFEWKTKIVKYRENINFTIANTLSSKEKAK